MSTKSLTENERDTYNIALEQIAYLVGLPVDREGTSHDFAENVVAAVAAALRSMEWDGDGKDLIERARAPKDDLEAHRLSEALADALEATILALRNSRQELHQLRQTNKRRPMRPPPPGEQT